MKLRLRLPIFATVALPLISFVAPSLARDSTPLNCNNPQTTAEMNLCASQEYQAADQKLNSVYRALKPKLNKQQQQRITDAQIAWIKFRDASCAYEKGQFEGGTLAGPTGTTCLARVTQQRTKELEGYLRDINNR